MSDVILLTADQANQVRGPSVLTPLVGLMPVGLTDGRYYLPASVLGAPQFATAYAVLAALPTADFSTVQSLLPTGP